MNILVCLSDPKHNRWYSTSENFLDLNLDAIIIGQSKEDDYKIQAFCLEEKLFETFITKDCHNRLKNELDTE